MAEKTQENFAGQPFFVGLDVHKNQWTVAIRTQGILVKRFSMNPSAKELKRFLERTYPGGTYQSVYEAGFCGFWPHSQLMEQGIDAHGYGLDSRFTWLREKGSQLPWVRPAVQWLLENRPPEPAQLSICHGDFHALNILYADDHITGVLDWPGFVIADPALDIAHTIMLMTIPSKYLALSLNGLSSVDWDRLVTQYLAAYRTHKPIDTTNLDYYQVRRCVMALIEGTEGHKVWQHPLIVQDLLKAIHDVTSIQVHVPS